MSRELVQLPNKDLWRGHTYKAKGESNIDTTPDPRPFAKIDAAMAAILQHASGNPSLTCLWCGTQGDSKEMREHLKTSHPSIVEPPTNEQIAAAALAANTSVKE